ncbi:hypothetical protein RBU49_17070 [Clostridium sp. MB40-C1]|uniref:hypothetical protein n=1 Tax=Clostridium sp. MB40-C1 TaxID=3070996 RepID=UPI0027E1053A|nr:hypothetical protein [Clostridium sp. MB40-C1]WMJ80494.1 hypothetical protein RBU49_17070 [Clostridium sp. MB40-C1]
MKNEDYLNRSYIRFTDFLSIAVSRELEYFILDSKFTSAFNYRVKEIIREVEKEGKKDAELSVLFNTDGEIALIDAGVLGKFISDNYNILTEQYYKGIKLEKVIKNIKGGGEKVKVDFIKISYSILYKSIEELYKEIKCKKELKDTYMDKYDLKKYTGNDSTVIVIVLLILEDICKYIEINDEILFSSINEIIFSNNL